MFWHKKELLINHKIVFIAFMQQKIIGNSKGNSNESKWQKPLISTEQHKSQNADLAICWVYKLLVYD